jgi:hypothetical protein
MKKNKLILASMLVLTSAISVFADCGETEHGTLQAFFCFLGFC